MKTRLGLSLVELCKFSVVLCLHHKIICLNSVLLTNVCLHRAQLVCTTAAVIGGKSLASQISERIVNTSRYIIPLDSLCFKYEVV